MVVLGVISLAAAVLCLVAERHLGMRGLPLSVAAFALVAGVALVVVGASDGVLGVLAVPAGVCVAAVGGAILIGRGVRRPGGVRCAPALMIRPTRNGWAVCLSTARSSCTTADRSPSIWRCDTSSATCEESDWHSRSTASGPGPLTLLPQTPLTRNEIRHVNRSHRSRWVSTFVLGPHLGGDAADQPRAMVSLPIATRFAQEGAF